MQPVEQLGTHMPTITRLLGERGHLSGDIAEFGVYAGATTFELADFGRWVWAFDTFEGIPAEDYTPGLDRNEPGKFVAPAELYDRLNEHELTIPVKGRFEDTLPKLTVTRGIVLAYLDCDLYKSAQQAFKWLAKHLVEGAVIVLDDYSTHKGIQKAVSEFLRDNPKAEFDGWEVIYWGKP